MKIKALFWHPQENRLRSFWRLGCYGLVLLATTMILGLASGLLLAALKFLAPNLTDEPAYVNFFQMLIVTLVMVVGTWVTSRWVDHRKVSSLGLLFNRNWWLDFTFGAFLGAILMTLIFGVELAAGWITIKSMLYAHPDYANFWIALLVYAFQFICVGLYEELFSRGYLLINLTEGLGWIKNQKMSLLIAYLITSSMFGIMHAINPGATLTSVINIMIAGLFLGLGMVLTGRLGLSIGLHITWNFFQGNIFGFPVSGMSTGVSVFQIVQKGDIFFTGGNFGPEGGLLSIFAILVGMAAILVWVQWREGKLHLGVLRNLFPAPQEFSETSELPPK